MRRIKCNGDCLNCILPKCKHDIADERKDLGKRYERVRHALYYQEHRQEVLEKVKEYNLKNRNSEICHKYYMAHKDEINKRNRERYVKDREKRLAESKAYYNAHRDEISARRKARYRALKAESEGKE